MTRSFPDYGLKAQDAERLSVYRSVLQPYAGIYVVFWYVCVYCFCTLMVTLVGSSAFFILISGLSVFWHFNGPDFIAACKHKAASRSIPIGRLSNLRALIRHKFAGLCPVVRWLEDL